MKTRARNPPSTEPPKRSRDESFKVRDPSSNPYREAYNMSCSSIAHFCPCSPCVQVCSQEDGNSWASSVDVTCLPINNQTSSRLLLAKRGSSNLYSHRDHHQLLGNPKTKAARRNLSCGESDVFSDEASNDIDDAQSARCPTPTPSLPPSFFIPTPTIHTKKANKSSSLPVFDPDMKSMLHTLFKTESACKIDHRYIEMRHGPSVLSEQSIDPSMRRTAIGWLIEVASFLHLSQDTLHLSVTLMDRFLSHTRGVPRVQLQLLMMACLLCAAKHEEERHPSVGELASLAGNCFTSEDLLRMESILLAGLKFRLSFPTSHAFVHLISTLLKLHPAVHAMASYLIELAMLEYAMLQYKPSQIAVAAVIASAKVFKDAAALETLPLLMQVPLYSSSILQCIDKLMLIQRNAKEEQKLMLHSATSPVVEKFASLKWHCVALHSFSAAVHCNAAILKADCSPVQN